MRLGVVSVCRVDDGVPVAHLRRGSEAVAHAGADVVAARGACCDGGLPLGVQRLRLSREIGRASCRERV